MQVTEPAKALVASKFASVGLKVYDEGSLDAKTIESNKLIDNHYYAIANKAITRRDYAHVSARETTRTRRHAHTTARAPQRAASTDARVHRRNSHHASLPAT
eukprot:5442209-Pleurochrysis_carterae.AAC.1